MDTTDQAQPVYRFESNDSWALTGDENGAIEFDLIVNKSKGVYERYLSVQISGFNLPDGASEPIPARANMMIMDKSQFDKLKTFFAQIKWEA